MRYTTLAILFILVASYAIANDSPRNSYKEQVEWDAQSANTELAQAAKALLFLNGWQSKPSSGGMTHDEFKQFKKMTRRAFKGGAMAVSWGRGSGFSAVYRTGDEERDAEALQAFDDEIRARQEEENESRMEAMIWAEAAYQRARKNAGLSYNRDMEVLFDRIGEHEQAPAPMPRRPPTAGPEGPMYPQGGVKNACAFTPNLRLITKGDRTYVAGQISATLLNGLVGEPLFNISILSLSRNSRSYDSRTTYQLRTKVIRPATIGWWAEWQEVRVGSRLKGGYVYGWQSSPSIEEASCQIRSSVSRYMLNENTPTNPFFMIGDKIGGIAYHVEVWHNGKVVGVKDGRLGTGCYPPSQAANDWFVPGRHEGIINLVY